MSGLTATINMTCSVSGGHKSLKVKNIVSLSVIRHGGAYYYTYNCHK